jgi:hypothetical protein
MGNQTDAYTREEPMTRLCRVLLGVGFVLFFAAANPVRADGMGYDGGCPAGGCGPGGCHGGCGGSPTDFGPYVTWYVGVPYWFPNYFAFGAYPYTDYNPVRYVTPPAESARIVREHLNAMAVMYASMGVPQGPPPTPAKESLPYPTPDKDKEKDKDKEAPKPGPR